MMRFLVVDDEPDLRMILRLNLERWGHQVAVAGDAEEAWAAIEADPPDAMLVDVSMPGESGIELIRRLRDAGRLPPRVVLLSAMLARDLAEEAPGIPHLSKPFGVADLRELVAELETAG